MQVHFFAAARSAAGTAQLSVPLAELRPRLLARSLSTWVGPWRVRLLLV